MEMPSKIYARSINRYSSLFVLCMVERCGDFPSASEHVSNEIPLCAFTNGDREAALSQAGHKCTSEHLSTCILNCKTISTQLTTPPTNAFLSLLISTLSNTSVSLLSDRESTSTTARRPPPSLPCPSSVVSWHSAPLPYGPVQSLLRW